MNPKLKKVTPSPIEIAAMILVNVFISLLNGVSSFPDEEAKFAI